MTAFRRILFSAIAAVIALTTFAVHSSVAQEKPEVAARIDFESELRPIPVLNPEEALAALKVDAGFRVELVAAEPFIRDPVAIDFDEGGRIFVVEFPQYNQKYVKEDVTERGAVKMLEDTDGDGRIDRSTVYADGLHYATAVACWDGGVFVGVAPDLLYFKDTDGDGVADSRRVVLTGFAGAPGRAGQAQLNSIRWGLDNRFHICSNLSGGNVLKSGNKDALPVNIRNRDVRFDPRSGEFEATSGGGQHGMCFDDWGRKFTCKNSEPFRMILYDEGYLRNNPYLAAPAPGVEITEEKKYTKLYRISGDEPWRVLRTRLRAEGSFPGPVEGEGGKAAPSGYFTSATGVTVYRGDAWPGEYRGNIFVGEVASNIVYRARLDPDGVGFVARRATPSKVEFLASTDNTFRPVQLANGPDGSLYVVDMCRVLIEGAAFLPPQLLKHIDVTGGAGLGRVYRIVPAIGERRAELKPGKASVVELVKLLEHPNAWHRETASRLLYTRQDRSAIEPLEVLARDSRSPLGRMHAWHALEGLEALRPGTVLQALGDASAEAREHAIRLAEGFAADNEEIRAKLFALTEDEAPRVRYLAAFSLGTVRGDAKTKTVVRFLIKEGGDPWMRLAALSSIREEAAEVFARLLGDAKFRAASHGEVILNELAAELGQANDFANLERSVDAIALLSGAEVALSQKLLRSILTNSRREARRRLVNSGNPIVVKAFEDLVSSARARAFDVKRDGNSRAAAVRALALMEYATVRENFRELLQSNQPLAVQRAALATLGSYADAEAGLMIVEAWPGLSPELRGVAMETLLSRPKWALACLAALEEGAIGRGEFGSAQALSLRNYPDEEVRERAAALLKGGLFKGRDDVVASYGSVHGMEGDPAKGRTIFAGICAACHRLDGVGNAIGAELAGIGQRGADEVLLHILDPNREVKPEHMLYALQTVTGENHAGMITGESAGSLTLRRPDGVDIEVRRVNIANLKSLGISYMPEGLENQVNVEAMADLLAYLASFK